MSRLLQYLLHSAIMMVMVIMTIIADLGTPHGGQPFRFGGKELVTANGLNEYDFGARQYRQAVPHFTRIDPLCEVSYHLSPYLFCGNDPVNKVDPSGMIWENPDEAHRLLHNVIDRINNLQNQVTILKTDIDNLNLADNEKSLTKFMIKENAEKIALLQNCISTIEIMGTDLEHIYAIEPTDRKQPHKIRQDEKGIIYIQSSSDSMTLHEITHIRQSIDEGGLVFVDNELRNSSIKVNDAVKNEINAYRTQYAMDPFNMPIPVLFIKWINNKYIQHIINPQTGEPLYPYFK